MAGGVQVSPNPTTQSTWQDKWGTTHSGPQPTAQGNPYMDSVTGSPNQYPLVGVEPTQQYGTNAQMQMQKQGETATSALSAQRTKEAMDYQDHTLANLSKVSGSTSAGGNVQYPGGVTPEQQQAAVEAEFARAKDTSGQIAKSAMTGLNDSMAARGLQGSGIQGEGMARIINGQAGGLSDLNREQAIQGLNYMTNANNMQYQGGITQRGQNIGLTQSLLGLLRGGGVAY